MRSTCDLAEGTNPNLPQVNNLFSFLFHSHQRVDEFRKEFPLINAHLPHLSPFPSSFFRTLAQETFRHRETVEPTTMTTTTTTTTIRARAERAALSV